MSISEIWSNLYSNNSKLQAFAVSEDSKIIWQTDNWNLVDSIEKILDICCNNKSKMKVAGVTYKTIRSTDDSFIASSDKKGHILMAKAHHLNEIWLMAWANSESDPELAIIDLLYAATKMANF
ncbi:MAG: hypothetical protein ACW98Y_01320 [Candidatus Thorarchaeota archaeon]|jgi:hypothetical protein